MGLCVETVFYPVWEDFEVSAKSTILCAQATIKQLGVLMNLSRSIFDQKQESTKPSLDEMGTMGSLHETNSCDLTGKNEYLKDKLSFENKSQSIEHNIVLENKETRNTKNPFIKDKTKQNKSERNKGKSKNKT